MADLLEMLGSLMSAPGEYTRGVFAGQAGERLTAEDLLRAWGMEQPGFGATLAADLFTDPLNYAVAGAGAAGASRLGKLGRATRPVDDLASLPDDLAPMPGLGPAMIESPLPAGQTGPPVGEFAENLPRYSRSQRDRSVPDPNSNFVRHDWIKKLEQAGADSALIEALKQDKYGLQKPIGQLGVDAWSTVGQNKPHLPQYLDEIYAGRDFLEEYLTDRGDRMFRTIKVPDTKGNPQDWHTINNALFDIGIGKKGTPRNKATQAKMMLDVNTAATNAKEISGKPTVLSRKKPIPGDVSPGTSDMGYGLSFENPGGIEVNRDLLESHWLLNHLDELMRTGNPRTDQSRDLLEKGAHEYMHKATSPGRHSQDEKGYLLPAVTYGGQLPIDPYYTRPIRLSDEWMHELDDVRNQLQALGAPPYLHQGYDELAAQIMGLRGRIGQKAGTRLTPEQMQMLELLRDTQQIGGLPKNLTWPAKSNNSLVGYLGPDETRRILEGILGVGGVAAGAGLAGAAASGNQRESY